MHIKPSDFGDDVGSWFVGSPLQNCEQEIVARNVVTVCRRRGDEWEPFTWEEYKCTVDHSPGWREHGVLNELVGKGLINATEIGNDPVSYSATKKFLATFADYVK